MIERVETGRAASWFCNTCSHDWKDEPPRARFASLEDFIKRSGVNREELATLAEIGALNAFGYHRREALWQIEKAIRPAGELYEGSGTNTDDSAPAEGDVPLSRPLSQADGGSLQNASEGPKSALGWGPSASADGSPEMRFAGLRERASEGGTSSLASDTCPLQPMNVTERLVADYAGTHLTIGPHPMALRRRELSLRGVLRAIDLPRERQGRRIRVAGTVITRQRPGTAKGFVFLTLEDETGIANIIVRPDVFAHERVVILQEPFLLVEGILQNQENVTAVRAERVEGIAGVPIEVDSHDFY
jgi:DNA polymerase III alpha subunit